MINRRVGIALCMLLLSNSVFAVQNGVLIRNETLHVKPASTSANVGSVARGSSVSVITRQSGWVQVRTGRTQGWVRLLSVRTAGSFTSNTASDIAGVAQMATGKRRPGQIVATAGVRGLSEEDLKSAHFNEQGLNELATYKLGFAEAQNFARQGKLVRQSVPYLPDPNAAN